MLMKKNNTTFIKKPNSFELLPRYFVIKNILNYASSLEIIKSKSIGKIEIILN